MQFGALPAYALTINNGQPCTDARAPCVFRQQEGWKCDVF